MSLLTEGDAAPPALALPLTKAGELRYGENPHQAAAFYADRSLAEAGRGGVASALQHHGKEVRPHAPLPSRQQWLRVTAFVVSVRAGRRPMHRYRKTSSFC